MIFVQAKGLGNKVSYHRISIVLPVHNQANYIEKTVTGMHEALSALPIPFELILVPNGCCDDSEALCQALSERLAGVRNTPTSRGGWGNAVRHGLNEASGDLLGYTNSARTAPEDLALVLERALDLPGVVLKARRDVREGNLRRLGSWLFNFQCRLLFGLRDRDLNGTPKVFPRRNSKLLALSRPDDLIDLEFQLSCFENHYPVVEVPTHSWTRHGGMSTTGWKTALRLYWGALCLWLGRRSAPAHA